MVIICVFRLSVVTSVSNIVHRVNIIIKIFLYSILFVFWTNQSNHHRCVCRPHYHHCHKLDNWSHNRLEIVRGRSFLFRIPTKDTVILFYSTLSPQKCTKLNTEKQNAQGHLGSNLTPDRENRNFRKSVVTNSTKALCRPRGHLSWQSHESWCHCMIHKKLSEKNEGWGHIWPQVAVWGLRQNL
jgi:hypothetical protein